jgi:hypothetical protein
MLIYRQAKEKGITNFWLSPRYVYLKQRTLELLQLMEPHVINANIDFGSTVIPCAAK